MDELTTLALAAGRGDRRALATFVDRGQAEVWRLCAHLVDRQSADDLTQETFVRAIGALPRFRGDSSARTWLLVIARRTCADEVRRRVRRRRLHARAETEARVGPGPADAADLGEAAVLDDLVSALPADRRDAFVLTQVLGLSYAEAADVCGCRVGTIRSRVSRARDALLAALDEAERGTGTG